MADAGTRIRVGVVGMSKFGRIRVDLAAEETVVRQLSAARHQSRREGIFFSACGAQGLEIGGPNQ